MDFNLQVHEPYPAFEKGSKTNEWHLRVLSTKDGQMNVAQRRGACGFRLDQMVQFVLSTIRWKK